MKIKIELYLPFQKLEQYNIETDLDDIIQALPNSDINKQDALDSILKYGLYDCLPEQMEFKEGEYILNFQVDNKIHQNTHHLLMCLIDQLSEKEADGYSLSLRKNKGAEIILTHPIYSPKEIIFLNNLKALEDENFFHIKIHYYENVKSGEKYSEIVIEGEENQTTLLIGGPYDTSNTIANEKEMAKYKDALNANLIEKMKNEKWTGHPNDDGNYYDEDKIIPYSRYLIRLKEFKFDEWADKLLLRRKEIAGKIKLSEELLEIMDLLKSDDTTIKLYSSEEWYGTYIDSEGDEEEEGSFTTESNSIVSRDFLLNKLNEYVKEITEDEIRRWLGLNSNRGPGTMRWKREVDLDTEVLKNIIGFEETELDLYGFAEWIGVSQCYDANPDVFKATDIEYYEPWNWDFDDREIEDAETYLEITVIDPEKKHPNAYDFRLW